MVINRLDISIVDEGPPADWVKINVKKAVSASSFSDVFSSNFSIFLLKQSVIYLSFNSLV